jgi:flagellar motor switch protein FliG
MALLTAEQKVAILLKSLAPEVTDTMLGQLGPEEAGVLRAQLEQLQSQPLPQQTTDDVLAEFDGFLSAVEKQMANQEAAGEGPAEPGAKTEATPSGPSSPPEESPPAPEAGGGDPFVPLGLLSPDRLAAALKDEQVRTMALLLNNLAPILSGEVLKRLPAAQRREVSLLLGQPLLVPRKVLDTIGAAVLQKGLVAEESAQENSDEARAKKTADVLRQLDRAERLAIVAELQERDPETAARVKEHLYHFEDILKVDDRSVQRLLSEVDSKSLGMAVKGAPENVAAKLLNNLSKRARETLTEEMEFLGNASPAQIQQAQKAIVEVMQRLDQAGELVMLE